MTQLRSKVKYFSPSLMLVFVCEGDIYDNKRKHLEEISSYSRSNDVICLEFKDKVLFMGQSRIAYIAKDTSEETKQTLEELGFTDHEEKTDIGDVEHFKWVAADFVRRMMLPIFVVPGQLSSMLADYPVVQISKNKIAVLIDSHVTSEKRECFLSDVEDLEHLDSNICREIIRTEIERGNMDRSERLAAYLLINGKWIITDEEWPVDLQFTTTTLHAIYNESVQTQEIRKELSEYLQDDLFPVDDKEADEVEEVPRAIVFYALIMRNHHMGAKQLAHMGYLRIKDILAGCSLIFYKEKCVQTSRSEAEKLRRLRSDLTDDAIGILNKVKSTKKLYLKQRASRVSSKRRNGMNRRTRQSFDIERQGEDVKDMAAKLILNEGCLSVAIQTKNSEFIQHKTTKRTINNIWYGKEQTREIMPLHVTMTLLHPILLPLLMINSTIWPLNRLYEIYRLPAMKVFNNVIGFLGFLLVFADNLLFDHRSKIPISEIFVVYWMAGFAIDEFFQIIATPRTNRNKETGIGRFKQYYSSLWNLLDIFAIVIFFAGIIKKYTNGDEEKDDIVAVLLVVTFALMCVRTLNLFCIFEFIGPNLVVIKGMVKDTVVFTIIMMIFLFMYTVSSYSLMYPNSPFEAQTVGDVIQSGLWILFGEIDTEQTKISEPDCTFNKTLYLAGIAPRCPESIGANVTPFIKAIYCALAVLMLLNLLVAIYNNTYQRIHEQSRFKWLELQENFLTEYTMKAIFPIHLQGLAIPFLIIHLLVFIMKKMFNCCLKRTGICEEEREYHFINVFVMNLEYKPADPLTLSAEVHAAQELATLELKAMEDDEITRLKSEMKKNSDANDKKTAGIISTVTNVRRDLDKIQRSVYLVKEEVSGIQNAVKTMDEKLSHKLDELEKFFGKHTIFKKFATADQDTTYM